MFLLYLLLQSSFAKQTIPSQCGQYLKTNVSPPPVNMEYFPLNICTSWYYPEKNIKNSVIYLCSNDNQTVTKYFFYGSTACDFNTPHKIRQTYYPNDTTSFNCGGNNCGIRTRQYNDCEDSCCKTNGWNDFVTMYGKCVTGFYCQYSVCQHTATQYFCNNKTLGKCSQKLSNTYYKCPNDPNSQYCDYHSNQLSDLLECNKIDFIIN